MKKLYFSFMIFIFVLIFTACSYQQELSKDDFGIYENGKLIISVDDVDYSAYFDDPDFDERTVTTMRGIKEGSTLEDVAKAYMDESFTIITLDKDENGFQKTFKTKGNELVKVYNENADRISLIELKLETLNDISIDPDKDISKLEDTDIVYVYVLDISFSDSKVAGISISKSDATHSTKTMLDNDH